MKKKGKKSKRFFQKARRYKKSPYRPKLRLISHDTFFKEIFRRKKVARAFLRAMLKPEAVALLDLDTLEVLEPDFLTQHFKHLHADLIYRVPLKESGIMLHFYVVLEHKSQNEYWSVFQTVRYAFQLASDLVDEAEKKKLLTMEFRIPIILPIIIYHGETKFSAPKDVNEYVQEFAGYEKEVFSQKVKTIDLSMIPDDDIPKDEFCPELHASLKLMKYIFSDNFLEKFREVLESLLPYTGPDYAQVNRIIWGYALSRAKHATPQQFQQIAKNLPNQYIKEDEMTGVLQRERKAGKIEGKIESILFILSQRGDVPQSIVERLRVIDPKNTSRLNELLLLATKSQTFEEFEKAL